MLTITERLLLVNSAKCLAYNPDGLYALAICYEITEGSYNGLVWC